MFGIDSGELLIIAIVALVVIGPKDLPRVMRTVGEWVGRARGMAKHFRVGIDTMMREAELDDLEKSWQATNDNIMREHPYPAPPPEKDWAAPVPALEGDPPAEAPPAPAPPRTAKPKTPPRKRSAPPIPSGPPMPPAGDTQ